MTHVVCYAFYFLEFDGTFITASFHIVSSDERFE
jgi:hypothetical protein